MRYLLLLFPFFCFAIEQPTVSVALRGQLGNQMFQIAAAHAVARDHEARLLIPSLLSKKFYEPPNFNGKLDNAREVFWRFSTDRLPKGWHPKYRYFGTDYKPIPYRPNFIMEGYFQSEKYFARYKEEILELFAPSEKIVSHLHSHYSDVINHPKAVAVHMRCYWPVHPKGIPDGKGSTPFIGFNYSKKAMDLFPEDSLFVVFSNNIPLCKKELAGYKKSILFISNEPYWHDLYLMSLCKHQIISNSSFSWWGAYMNRNPEKIVIAPKVWFDPNFPATTTDLLPNDWRVIQP